MEGQNLNDMLQLNHRPDFVDVEVTGITVGADAKPLSVRINKPDRLAMAEEMEALPGPRPKSPNDGEAPDDEEAAMLELGARLIARFAAVQLPDGSWRSPAFSFSTPPDPDLIDGADLSFVDIQTLTINAMQIGGYLGGAAGVGFLGQRSGSSSSN